MTWFRHDHHPHRSGDFVGKCCLETWFRGFRVCSAVVRTDVMWFSFGLFVHFQDYPESSPSLFSLRFDVICCVRLQQEPSPSTPTGEAKDEDDNIDTDEDNVDIGEAASEAAGSGSRAEAAEEEEQDKGLGDSFNFMDTDVRRRPNSVKLLGVRVRMLRVYSSFHWRKYLRTPLPPPDGRGELSQFDTLVCSHLGRRSGVGASKHFFELQTNLARHRHCQSRVLYRRWRR